MSETAQFNLFFFFWCHSHQIWKYKAGSAHRRDRPRLQCSNVICFLTLQRGVHGGLLSLYLPEAQGKKVITSPSTMFTFVVKSKALSLLFFFGPVNIFYFNICSVVYGLFLYLHLVKMELIIIRTQHILITIPCTLLVYFFVCLHFN